MTQTKRRQKKDGPRTEVFAMRLDPKLKYLAEIAARRQRRSLANFIEWAIEEALCTVTLDQEGKRSAFGEGGFLWDVEPSDRLINLAENFPDLMSYEEQRIWKAIQLVGPECADLKDQSHSSTYAFRRGVRRHWQMLVEYSVGLLSERELVDAVTKAEKITN